MCCRICTPENCGSSLASTKTQSGPLVMQDFTTLIDSTLFAKANSTSTLDCQWLF